MRVRLRVGTTRQSCKIGLACTCGIAFAESTSTAPNGLMLIAAAQAADPRRRQTFPQTRDRHFVRRSVTAVRIDATEAPHDRCRSIRCRVGKGRGHRQFHARSPNPYEPATERTVVRILYDANNLYFAFYNYDSAPDQIVVRNMQRDGFVYTSDSVMIYLDPGQTRRNAYNFEIGASGGRTDQLELNNTEELSEWDTIWDARANRGGRLGGGVRHSVQEPLLRARQTTWGFDVARRIYHKNERVHWSGFNPALEFTDVEPERRPGRHRERKPGHRARCSGLRRAALEARLAARSDGAG